MPECRRGEGKLTVNGTVYSLKLTIAACDELQREMGMGLVDLVERIGANNYGVLEICPVLQHALQGGGLTHLTREETLEIMNAVGLVPVVRALEPVLFFPPLPPKTRDS